MQNEEQKRSFRMKVQDLIRRLLRRKEAPPEGDPYAYVPSPLRRGPKGRSGGAVAEIENDSYQSFLPRRQ